MIKPNYLVILPTDAAAPQFLWGPITWQISARFLEQIPMKSNWRLHGEGPSPGCETEFQPGLKNRKEDGCRCEVEAISVE